MIWWVLGILALVSLVAYFVYRRVKKAIEGGAIKHMLLGAVGLD